MFVHTRVRACVRVWLCVCVRVCVWTCANLVMALYRTQLQASFDAGAASVALLLAAWQRGAVLMAIRVIREPDRIPARMAFSTHHIQAAEHAICPIE